MKKLKNIIRNKLAILIRQHTLKRLIKLGYKDKHIASVWDNLKEIAKLNNHDLKEILQVMKMQDYLNTPREPITMVYGRDYTIVED